MRLLIFIFTFIVPIAQAQIDIAEIQRKHNEAMANVTFFQTKYSSVLNVQNDTTIDHDTLRELVVSENGWELHLNGLIELQNDSYRYLVFHDTEVISISSVPEVFQEIHYWPFIKNENLADADTMYLAEGYYCFVYEEVYENETVLADVVWISTTTYLVEKIQNYGFANTVSTWSFEGIDLNPPFDSDYFMYPYKHLIEKYPNYTIEDWVDGAYKE